jgi:molybdopterin converting factor small subunit
MRVSVVFYARLADLARRREWLADMAADATAGDVWRAAVGAHAELDAMSGRVSCAINAEFATLGTGVRDGDEVAFLPPVSGGAGKES